MAQPFIDIEQAEAQKPQVLSQREQVERFILDFTPDGKHYPYRDQLGTFAATGNHSLVIDFRDLETSNNDLIVGLLQDPDNLLQDFREGAITAIGAVSTDRPRNLNIRFKRLTQMTALRDVNVGLLDKMFMIAGIIVRVSERKNIMSDAAFVCPDGHTTNVKQDTEDLKKPPTCSGSDCKYLANNLELDQKNSTFLDYQMVRIQELPDELPAGQMPRGFDINMTDDMMDVVRPGDHALITGILRAVKERGIASAKRRIFDSEIDCNYAEVKEKDAGATDITQEDIAAIKEIASKPDAYGRLVHSMVPAIMGHDDVKEAILLQLAGSVPISLPDGSKRRGDFHILLAGDPGVAKSEMLRFAAHIAARSVLANGRATSAAGLGAGIVKGHNDIPMLEVGVLPLADQGLAAIDELDKMKAEDRSALHEAMEQQTVVYNKAGFHVTLNTRVSVLAACNPIMGTYNPNISITENINIIPSLLSRFDLIFIIRDIPGDNDSSMAKYILSTHMNSEYANAPPIPFLLLKKYIAYTRANIKPKMTQEASDKIEEYFLQLRKLWEPGKIPVTPRTIEALIRLSVARAKILLKSEATAEDAEQAISLMQRMVQDVLVDPNTKQTDFGQMVGVSQQQIGKTAAMMSVLKEVKAGGGTVEKREFKDMLKKTGKFTDDEEAEKALRQLYQSGRIYEISAGKFRVISG